MKTRIKLASLAVSVLFAFNPGGIVVQAENSKTAQTQLKHAYTSVEDDVERKAGHEVAYFAGGCFWGTQYEFKNIPGVISTAVGYSGGKTQNPTYQDVCGHVTGHAEAVRIVYDPKKLSFTKLCEEFFAIHDPTTLNRQGPDIGDQYRSTIFFENDEQKKLAEKAIADEQKTQPPNKKVVTTLEKFGTFWTAEEYHQDYFAKTGRGVCHVRRK
jgi:methionine-S-sulfoxide reductase